MTIMIITTEAGKQYSSIRVNNLIRTRQNHYYIQITNHRYKLIKESNICSAKKLK